MQAQAQSCCPESHVALSVGAQSLRWAESPKRHGVKSDSPARGLSAPIPTPEHSLRNQRWDLGVLIDDKAKVLGGPFPQVSPSPVQRSGH